MRTTARKRFKIGASALAFLFLTGQAWAGGYCASPEESAALKIAALQQQLMVAALSCSETGSYNRFVIAYRTDLQRSDAVLQGYFLHSDPHGGVAAYHAYKTRLANKASLRSLHDIVSYCADARAVFNAALARYGQPLAALVSGQPAAIAIRDTECTNSRRVAGRQ